ncbi:MAG: M20/M25/M40 family metallo-hydrolase, partial [bacterium]|nr:M20/M25/M40 family metallo-hydrolase [bacterium]
VGVLEPKPNAANVIPGVVKLVIEIRHLVAEKIAAMVEKAERLVRETCVNSGLTYEINAIKASTPTLVDPKLKHLLEVQAKKLNINYINMPSGAGHDSQSLTKLMPIAMIFVPSVGGISHSCAEYSRPEDIEACATLMFHVVRSQINQNIPFEEGVQ